MPPRREGYRRTVSVLSILVSNGLLTFLISAARMKAVAYLIGPTGVGLYAGLQSLNDFGTKLVCLGLPAGSVRLLSYRPEKGSRLLSAMRTVLLCASIGLSLCLLFGRKWISQRLLQSEEYQWDVVCVAIAVLLNAFCEADQALLQSRRAVSAFARARLRSALISSSVAIGLYATFGMRSASGVLVSSYLVTLLVLRLELNKVTRPRPWLSGFLSLSPLLGIAAFGITLFLNGLMVTGSGLFIRSYLGASLDLRSIGLFSAAFGLIRTLFSIVSDSLSLDYYPSLAASSDDTSKLRSLVTQQSVTIFLIATPPFIFLFATAPLVLRLLYTEEFLPATALMELLAIGSIFRLYAIPFGFILLAKELRLFFFATQVIFWGIFSGAVVILAPRYGLEGAGFAYVIASAIYLPVVYIISCHCVHLFMLNKLSIYFVLSLIGIFTVFFCIRIAEIDGARVSISILAGVCAIGSVTILRQLIKKETASKDNEQS
ncbi:MAG: oligosaccharide flippase family protein [Myxococcota bacterium]